MPLDTVAILPLRSIPSLSSINKWGIIEAIIMRYFGARSIGFAVRVREVRDGHELRVSPIEMSVRRFPYRSKHCEKK
jgi:hypothetical protein